MAGVYTLTAHPGLEKITCIALETLPHETLPLGNSGRDMRLGNFLISQFKVAILDNAEDTESREIPIRRVCSDFAGRGGAKTSWVENMLESTTGKHWTAWPDVHISHRLVFELQEPISVPENGALRITIDCVDPEYPRDALGRFRVSASESSTAFAQEQQRLAVFKIEDAWEQLAAVYHLAGNESKLEELLSHQPLAVFGIADLYANVGAYDEAAQWLSKAETTISDTPESRLRLARGYNHVATKMKNDGHSHSIGQLVQDAGHPREVIKFHTRAIEILQPEYEQNPESGLVKSQLLFALRSRAIAHACLGIETHSIDEHQQAVNDWGQVIDLSSDTNHTIYIALQATSRIQCEPVQAVLADAEKLERANQFASDGLMHYNLACTYALASEKNTELKKEYADHAMELLRKFVELRQTNPYMLQAQVHLKPLQHRDDFKQLLSEVEEIERADKSKR